MGQPLEPAIARFQSNEESAMADFELLQKPNDRDIRLIGVASGIGAQDKGCADGPDALRAIDAIARLQMAGLNVAWKETLRVRKTAQKNLVRVLSDLCDRLANKVESVVRANQLPVIIGGDHSCAIGTWRGVCQALPQGQSLGLIWVDAHMDSHTPETSPSGALHGMPVACLLGVGEPALTDWRSNAARLLPQNVCLIGARSFEAEEPVLLSRLGVRVFDMEEVTQRGLSDVMSEALEIAQNGTSGFGVTIDMDALDPQDAPGVGTPESGGIRASELISALEIIKENPHLLGVEISEYNPHHDQDAITAKLILDLLSSILSFDHEATTQRLSELQLHHLS
jgi:arginase